MSDREPTVRDIDVRISTIGGHEHQVRLPEDAPELRELFTAFVNRPAAGDIERPNLVQLPLDGGSAACTLAVDQIVSIVTCPPVVVQLEQPPAVPPQPLVAYAPRSAASRTRRNRRLSGRR